MAGIRDVVLFDAHVGQRAEPGVNPVHDYVTKRDDQITPHIYFSEYRGSLYCFINTAMYSSISQVLNNWMK